jgi:hypothetical protein
MRLPDPNAELLDELARVGGVHTDLRFDAAMGFRGRQLRRQDEFDGFPSVLVCAHL